MDGVQRVAKQGTPWYLNRTVWKIEDQIQRKKADNVQVKIFYSNESVLAKQSGWPNKFSLICSVTLHVLASGGYGRPI